jgi:hypothetical protein
MTEVMKRCPQQDSSLAIIDEWTMSDRISSCHTEFCLISCQTINDRMSLNCPELYMIIYMLSWSFFFICFRFLCMIVCMLLASVYYPTVMHKRVVTSLVREEVIASSVQHITKQHVQLVTSLKHPTKRMGFRFSHRVKMKLLTTNRSA